MITRDRGEVVDINDQTTTERWTHPDEWPDRFRLSSHGRVVYCREQKRSNVVKDQAREKPFADRVWRLLKPKHEWRGSIRYCLRVEVNGPATSFNAREMVQKYFGEVPPEFDAYEVDHYRKVSEQRRDTCTCCGQMKHIELRSRGYCGPCTLKWSRQGRPDNHPRVDVVGGRKPLYGGMDYHQLRSKAKKLRREIADHPGDEWMDTMTPCRGKTDMWFDEDQQDEAVDACYDCPVMLPCLELAIAEDWDIGVWGGTTPQQRRQEIAKRIQRGERNV